MQVLPCSDDPALKFSLPNWYRVLDTTGESLAFFRHQADADAFLMQHGYANRLTKGRQMGALLTAHTALSAKMAGIVARRIGGFRGTRQDQQSRGANIVFLFDDGSEFSFATGG